VRTLLIVAVTAVLACDPFAPHENESRTVEGCTDAVAHLHTCCPAWNRYLSCTYFDSAIPTPDITRDQSRCLANKSCDEIERALAAGKNLCGISSAGTRCR